ncbi:hypothetical protein [Streptomyces sp. Go-475]|uniref:hypothetical protein n=1 Tax=Streptomyces sp. Go-475 TaxID=2072505 RepID=UPI000DF0AE23|nr:hypothetical protein [Streptomyces sp. Go-475]AXE88622.1 hypothetical protein C1703_26780 [Streptomyces sp. Go-475]
MNHRPPSEPAARFRAPDWPQPGPLCPEDAELSTEMLRFFNMGQDLLLTTNMVSVGIDQSRLGLLHTASAHLHDLGKFWLVEPKTYSRRSPGEDVARILLRTAEEISGIPCSASGLLLGLNPTPAPVPLVVTDGIHRLVELKSALHMAAGSGKTANFVINLVDRLTQRMGRLSRFGHDPTTAELGHIANAAYALSALLLDLVQRLLAGYVRFFGRLVAVPPNESSPCGLLRLAAPRVPRAPGVGQVPGPTEFALAA